MKIDRTCEYCGTAFKAHKREVNRGGARFCSQSCSSRRIRTDPSRTNTTCAWCHKDFWRPPAHKSKSKSGLYFCSRTCKDRAQGLNGLKDFQLPHYTGNGLDGYRDRAIEFYGSKCIVCGYQKDKRVLHVHHRDQNRKHNSLENLAVLCPTCHVEVHIGIRQLPPPLVLL